jgi:hypothetical protein
METILDPGLQYALCVRDILTALRCAGDYDLGSVIAEQDAYEDLASGTIFCGLRFRFTDHVVDQPRLMVYVTRSTYDGPGIVVYMHGDEIRITQSRWENRHHYDNNYIAICAEDIANFFGRGVIPVNYRTVVVSSQSEVLPVADDQISPGLSFSKRICARLMRWPGTFGQLLQPHLHQPQSTQGFNQPAGRSILYCRETV